jgi:hypothetical protein
VERYRRSTAGGYDAIDASMLSAASVSKRARAALVKVMESTFGRPSGRPRHWLRGLFDFEHFGLTIRHLGRPSRTKEAGRAVLFACPSAAWKNLPSCLVAVKCRKVRVTGGPERSFFGGARPRSLGDQSGDA